NAAVESKQDGSGEQRGKRATPPDGIWRALQEKATNGRAEGQGNGERQTEDRQVAAEEMRWSHIRDQRPEHDNVEAFGDCEEDRNTGEETRRSELRIGQRRWQHRKQAQRKEGAGG